VVYELRITTETRPVRNNWVVFLAPTITLICYVAMVWLSFIEVSYWGQSRSGQSRWGQSSFQSRAWPRPKYVLKRNWSWGRWIFPGTVSAFLGTAKILPGTILVFRRASDKRVSHERASHRRASHRRKSHRHTSLTSMHLSQARISKACIL
jgi:hypothetical protein